MIEKIMAKETLTIYQEFTIMIWLNLKVFKLLLGKAQNWGR